MNKPFWKQIIEFNRPQYVTALLVCAVCVMLIFFLPSLSVTFWICTLVLSITVWFSVLSVVASYFIYDTSNLYKFTWLESYLPTDGPIVNIIAGYDNSISCLHTAFPQKEILHLDFFEIGVTTTTSIIKAARESSSVAKFVRYSDWKTPAKFDLILFMQSFHELRTTTEKAACLMEAAKHLKPGGRIIIADHLRNIPNFLIYGSGAFHFFSRRIYKDAFLQSDLSISEVFTVTAFVNVFVLHHHHED